MKRFLLVLAVGSVLAAPASASAAPDQSQTSTPGCCPDIHEPVRIAQTFTAGISGNLDQVDLFIGRIGSPGPLTVDIRESSGGVPSGSVLASEIVAQQDVFLDQTSQGAGAWLSVPLSPPAPSTAGVQYAIELSALGANPSDRYVWRSGVGDPYPAGTLLESTDGGATWHLLIAGWDQAFKTFVSKKTTLVAKPALLSTTPLETVLGVEARLTSAAGGPLAGETISFSRMGHPICEATTNASGVASCTGLLPDLQHAPLVQAALGLGYDASFAGDDEFAPSSDHAPLIRIGPRGSGIDIF